MVPKPFTLELLLTDLILVEQTGSTLKTGINRPERRNAINQEMFRGLAAAYTRLCDNPELRCGILYSTSELFTADLDLMDMAAVLTGQEDAPQLVEDDQVDPFDWASVAGKQGRKRTKPIISAINGKCEYWHCPWRTCRCRKYYGIGKTCHQRFK